MNQQQQHQLKNIAEILFSLLKRASLAFTPSLVKANLALERYKVHAVVANILDTRKDVVGKSCKD
jgi:hypothetical protein